MGKDRLDLHVSCAGIVDKILHFLHEAVVFRVVMGDPVFKWVVIYGLKKGFNAR